MVYTDPMVLGRKIAQFCLMSVLTFLFQEKF